MREVSQKRPITRPRGRSLAPRGRVSVGSILVVIAALGLLAVSGGHLRPTAHVEATIVGVGERLAVPAGYLRVDKVRPDIISHDPKQHTTALPDPLPDGYRRFYVDVSLSGEDTRLFYSPEKFTVTAPGFAAVAPHRAAEAAGVVYEGQAVSITMMFQVAADAHGLVLHFDGQDAGVALDDSAAGDRDNHSH